LAPLAYSHSLLEKPNAVTYLPVSSAYNVVKLALVSL
jgi:hypothetical protein